MFISCFSAQGASAAQGGPIAKGQSIRLLHSATDKWLHSHLFKSPLSGQQEVSAFGSKVQSDTGDSWSVWWDGGAHTWTQDMTVRLFWVCCSPLMRISNQAVGDGVLWRKCC